MATIFFTLHPKQPKADTAINWSEALWEKLSERGYGAAKQQKAKYQTKNWYMELPDSSRQWFDKFWSAYNYKYDRNGAARRWFELGELTSNEYEHIIYAASVEAQDRANKKAQGITPIYAQGWLSGKRYMDIPKQQEATAKRTENERRSKIIELKADLAHYASIDSDFARNEVKKIKSQLQQLESIKQ